MWVNLIPSRRYRSHGVQNQSSQRELQGWDKDALAVNKELGQSIQVVLVDMGTKYSPFYENLEKFSGSPVVMDDYRAWVGDKAFE